MSSTAASGEAPHGAIVDKSSADGDEEIVGMSLAVTVGSSGGGAGSMEPEIIDPAILAVSLEGRTTHRPYQYTRERLLELKEAPLSKRRPEYLNPQHNNSQGLWDPERWHHDWKRSETPCENGPKDLMPENHKRRSGDPRERLRKEQDGIVLSPQRRSFNSGCFVPVTQPPTRSGRPDSPLSSKGDQHLGHREISQGARRIGSGRIIARDVSWDYRPDKGDLDGPEYGFGRSGPGSGPGRERKDTDRDREDRYDRRSFGRDFDRDRERDKDRHITRNGRYNDRRRISNDNKDDEPEWFSGGPTSQTETIELRGFEDICETDRLQSNSRKKQSPSQKKRSKERAITKMSNDSLVSKDDSPKGPGARSTPTPQDGPNQTCGPAPHSPIQEEQPEGGTGSEDDKSDAPTDMSTTSVPDPTNNGPPMDFNLEDFLKMDSIPELLTNGVGNDVGPVAGSKFSRWFNKEASPVHREEDSRRSSLQDEHLVNNIINGLSDSDTYFTPISPAAATSSGSGAPGGSGRSQTGAKPVTLLEMLQRGKQSQAMNKQPNTADVPPVLKNIEVPGKVLSLEELEARMRQGNERSQEPTPGPQAPNLNRCKQDEDMSAFKRLLAQVSGGQAVPASNGPLPHKQGSHQPMSLLQMLSKSQQEDARAAAAQQHHGLLGPPSPGGAGPHVPSDLVLKLHQVQQHQRQQQQQAEMLSKLMSSGSSNTHRQQFGISQHANEMPPGHGVSGRELLQRPEAVAILQGLKRGDITPQHLLQQLAANPAMQPRHRELLMTILKQNQNVGPSPRVLSPIPPPQHMLFQQQQQQQQLRVSPLPPTGMQQRIPSPRELQAHTQGIMQRALIKKKLEEQQENFRKKQEMQQRSQSPAVGSSVVGSNPPPCSVQGPAVSGTARASPAKHMSSPTPLAFTPTSVLRKMTAEKEVELGSKEPKAQQSSENHSKASSQSQPQGRAVTGMRQPPVQQQPQQPQNWNIQQPIKQPVGRPIVKGNNNYQFMPQDYQQQMQMQQQRSLYQQRAKMGQQQQQQFNMQSRVMMPQQMQNLQQQMHQQRAKFGHPLIVGRLFDDRGMPVAGRGFHMELGSSDDGDLSPTSDQLARWFSPELLAQARAGKLPDMPQNIAQNALSLEELERIQQNTAPVHN